MNFDLDFETVTGRCTVQKISHRATGMKKWKN